MNEVITFTGDELDTPEQMKTKIAELKNYLTVYVQSVTKPSRGGMYECPLCGSGTGEHGTGAFKVYEDTQKWQCFACGKHGDLFDLVAEMHHLDRKRDFRRLTEIVRATVGKASDVPPVMPIKKEFLPAEQKDYTEYFRQCAARISDTQYHRGISLATLQQYNIGYDPAWKSQKAGATVPPTPRLIIPTSPHSYIARDTRPPESSNPAYAKMKEGALSFFNGNALSEPTRKPLFITEGEIDALSIVDVGGDAVALGSVNRVDKFIACCREHSPARPLIIAMDSDQAGRDAAAKLSAGLQEIGLPAATEYQVGRGCKDANDLLMSDRGALQREVQEAMGKALHMVSNAGRIQGFIREIKTNSTMKAVPTGFEKIDNELDGGLREGLYIVGAISSLGKTTLISQIGDNIAMAGHDVLCIALEMSANELMARSISRHTFEIQMAKGGDMKACKTALGISDGSRYARYNDTEKALIHAAFEAYGNYANRIYTLEGLGDIGVMQVRKMVERYISFTGKAPVVIVDYLQVLAPFNARMSDKQNTDKAVLELKRISRDYKAPVIAISSFNRANYQNAVTMEAFKESGAIEYSADVLLGLQLAGAGNSEFDATTAKQKTPREIELVVLKNRRGRTGGKVELKYYPMFNYFKED